MNEKQRAERILSMCKKGAAEVQAKRFLRARTILSLVKLLQHPAFTTLEAELLTSVNEAVAALEASIPVEA